MVATPDSPATELKAQRAIPNYRQQLKKVIPAEYFLPDKAQLWWLLPHAIFIGACYWLLTAHFSYWLAPIMALAIGHSFACMGFLAHDISHGGTIKNLFWRDLLTGYAFSPLAISPRLWRRWHNAEHHGHTQIKDLDPDHLFTMEEFENSPVLQALYRLSPLARNLVIFSSFCYRMTQQTQRMLWRYLLGNKVPPTEKATMLLQTVAQFALWGGLTWWLGSQVLIWGYLVPVLVANAIVISYIATNHFLNPLADESDVLGTSLSVTLPAGLRWLDPLHHWFGAHVAHHLFPQVSARHGRSVDRLAKELFPDRFHEMSIFRALKMLWDTPWVYEDNTTLIDPRREWRVPTLGHGLERLWPFRRRK